MGNPQHRPREKLSAEKSERGLAQAAPREYETTLGGNVGNPHHRPSVQLIPGRPKDPSVPTHGSVSTDCHLISGQKTNCTFQPHPCTFQAILQANFPSQFPFSVPILHFPSQFPKSPISLWLLRRMRPIPPKATLLGRMASQISTPKLLQEIFPFWQSFLPPQGNRNTMNWIFSMKKQTLELGAHTSNFQPRPSINLPQDMNTTLLVQTMGTPKLHHQTAHTGLQPSWSVNKILPLIR